MKEIAACTPRVVIALGGPASKALTTCRIPHQHFRHGANGCPSLDDSSHDEGFAEVARQLDLDPGIATFEEFLAFRRAVEEAHFPRKKLGAGQGDGLTRPPPAIAHHADGTGLSQVRLRELIVETGLGTIELKSWPRIDGVSGRKLSFANDPRIREIHLRGYRVAHPACEPYHRATVRSRIRPSRHPTAVVEEVVRLALRALVDHTAGEQVD